MNLKISDKSFRFRITNEELSDLIQGRDLDQRVCVGQHCFSYRITSAADGPEMKLRMAVAGFCLYVPRQALEDLAALGRSKDGISFVQGGVEIALQVDVRKQALKKAA